ncbi:MAG: precorrin-2 dehydrogenase/sirohydrochlorin ferrochelatase family protein [Candidatus Rifleibacteriota bacterium]
MKMMPLFFNLQNHKVLIVGGGRVALRKARALCEAGAVITVIAPEILPEFKEIAGLKLIHKPAEPGDLSREFSLVFIATDKNEVNETLGRHCREQGILVNRCDDFTQSDFVSCTRLERNPVSIGIFCSGVAEMSKFIQARLNKCLNDEIIDLARIMAEIRPLAKEKLATEKQRCDFFARFINDETLEKIARNGYDEVRNEVLACL